MSKGLTSEFPLPAKNECRSNRKSEGGRFQQMAKGTPILLTSAGRKQVVVEEKRVGEEKRLPSPPSS